VFLRKGEDVEQRVEDEEGVWDGGRECVERYLGVTIAKGSDCEEKGEAKDGRKEDGQRKISLLSSVVDGEE
jgi:hypothetical protein